MFWKAFLISRMARMFFLDEDVAMTIRMESIEAVGEKL